MADTQCGKICPKKEYCDSGTDMCTPCSEACPVRMDELKRRECDSVCPGYKTYMDGIESNLTTTALTPPDETPFFSSNEFWVIAVVVLVSITIIAIMVVLYKKGLNNVRGKMIHLGEATDIEKGPIMEETCTPPEPNPNLPIEETAETSIQTGQSPTLPHEEQELN